MQCNAETTAAFCLCIVLWGESYSLQFKEPRAVEKAERQSGLSNVRCLHKRVQMSLLNLAANNLSLQLQNSGYNLVIILNFSKQRHKEEKEGLGNGHKAVLLIDI